MISLFPDSDAPFAHQRRLAAAQYEDAARVHHFHEILDITRLVTAAVPLAAMIVIDVEHRWTEPIGPTLQQILDPTGYVLWERYTTPPPELAVWRTADDARWDQVVPVIDRDLAAATRLDNLQELGWRELAQPGHFLVLRLPGRDLVTGEWTYLPDFVTPDANVYSCALRSCRHCSGEGLVADRDVQAGTRTCNCVHTARW